MIVPWPLGAFGFKNKSDGCDIPILREKPRVEELLHCPYHIGTDDWPCGLVEPTIKPINARGFILRNALHCLPDILS